MIVSLLVDFFFVSILLDAADSKDKETQKPAAAAVTMVTTAPVAASRDPVLNISDWKTSDVQNWLKKNNLKHLQTWYDINCHRRIVNPIT